MTPGIVSFPQGHTAYKRIAVDTPAAGAEWTLTVPDRVAWDLLGITFIFDPTMALPVRISAIIVTNNGSHVWTTPAAIQTGGDQTTRVAIFRYARLIALPSTPIATGGSVLFGPFILLPNDIITTTTSNFQAGDQYSQILLHVNESIRP